MKNTSREPIDRQFFDGDAVDVAEALIGVTLLVNGIGGIITETEAYDESDAASHCFAKWRSALNESMYLPGGHAYICPGRHFYNLNLVCRESGFGSAVLIRALHPLPESIPIMKSRRDPLYENGPPQGFQYLCAGPGPVCESLAIAAKHDGRSLYESPFELFGRLSKPEIKRGSRIGITKAIEIKWRFSMVRDHSQTSTRHEMP